VPARFFYHLGGVSIESEIVLPTPLAAPACASSIVLRVAPPSSLAAIPDDAWRRDHGLSVARVHGAFVLRLLPWAHFWIDSGTTVTGMPGAQCGDEVLAQLFLDQVLPRVLHLRARFAFHASAVAMRGDVVAAFLGNSGDGKSTLASSLARAETNILLSDDCLAVSVEATGIVAHPSYASARLWPESAEAIFPERLDLPLATPRSAKRRASLPVAHERMPLRRLYVLKVSDGTPTITRLPPRDAFGALAAHLYRIDPCDRRLLAAEFDLLARIVSAVPVATLAYRRSFADLGAVRDAIVSDLQ
jgi:hypothetical protein